MHKALRVRLEAYPRVVFDLDGTLYDVRDYERPALAEVAALLREKTGLGLTGMETALWARREADRHAPNLFDEVLAAYGLPGTWVGACVQAFRGYAGTGLQGASSLAPLLAGLHGTGIRLALVSNGRPEVQMRKLAALELAPWFDHCIYCHPDRTEELKPRPWAWGLLEAWRAGEDTVYVGDDAVDADFARNGCADFIHFSFRNPAYGN